MTVGNLDIDDGPVFTGRNPERAVLFDSLGDENLQILILQQALLGTANGFNLHVHSQFP